MTKSIGLFLLTRQNDYQRLQETSAVAAARSLKVPLEVHFAENDVRLQAEQIHAFIHAHPAGSAIAVEPVSEATLEQVARHAALADMGWVMLNRTSPYMDALRLEFSQIPMVVVTADQKEIGRIQGKQFEALLRGKGLLLYVSGPPGASAANDRLAGMKEIIEGTAIKYHLVHGDWSEEGGQQTVSRWLRGAGPSPGIQLVGCQNDAMAAGALRAIASAVSLNGPHAPQIPVTGIDGNPQYGVPLVDRQRLAATVIMPPVAGEAVELIHKTWTVEGFFAPPLVRLAVRSYPGLGSIQMRIAR